MNEEILMNVNDGYGPIHTGKLMMVFSVDSKHLFRIIDHHVVKRNSPLDFVTCMWV